MIILVAVYIEMYGRNICVVWSGDGGEVVLDVGDKVDSRYEIIVRKGVKDVVYLIFGGIVVWDVGRVVGDIIDEDIGREVDIGDHEVYGLEIGGEVDYENYNSVIKDVKDGFNMKADYSIGWYVDRNVHAEVD